MRDNQQAYVVTVDFDEEAKVWYVVHSDVPGLNTCAPTIDEISKNCSELIPELLELNREPAIFNKVKSPRHVPYDMLVRHAYG